MTKAAPTPAEVAHEAITYRRAVTGLLGILIPVLGWIALDTRNIVNELKDLSTRQQVLVEWAAADRADIKLELGDVRRAVDILRDKHGESDK